MVKKSSTLLEGVTKECFDFVNMVRANPKVILPKLEEMKNSFKKKELCMKGQVPLRTFEGKSAVVECIKFIKKQPPTCQFEWDELTGRACMNHCKDIGPKGQMGHKSSNGGTLRDRIRMHGKMAMDMAENILFGSQHTGEEIIIALIIDDNNANRGHRTKIFSDSYSVIGIFVGAHTRSKFMSCMVLADERVISAAMKKKMDEFKNEAVHVDKPPGSKGTTRNQVKLSGNKMIKTSTTFIILEDGTKTFKRQVKKRNLKL